MMGSAKESTTGFSLDQIFGPEGILSRRLPQYEFRNSQLHMSEAVLEAIRERHHLCVEAGTGTGKTLAYLIPALHSRKRVIVSTATRNLQDQLFFNDIPFIRRHLFPSLAASYMKGRQNYLCLKKFHQADEQGYLLEEARRKWAKLSEWVESTESGDRVELSWLPDRDDLWKDLDARSETCIGQKCDYFDRCYITRMRQEAFQSDIVVVNHALFFANLAIESDEVGRILPDSSIVILDEAHEVENIASDHFGRRVSNYQLEELCRDFEALFADSPSDHRKAADLRTRSSAFFDSLPGAQGRYSFNLSPSTPPPGFVDIPPGSVRLFQRMKKALMVLFHDLSRRSESPPETSALCRRLEQLIVDLDQIFQSNPNQVVWLEKRGRGIFLHQTPINIAAILEEKLFSRTETTILTSATLTTTGGNFQYVKERLGLRDSRDLKLPGEFDYESQAILYIPAALPEPRSAGYLRRVIREIQEILKITQGHAFLLFTSFEQMNRVHEALQGDPYPLLRQGEAPKEELLKRFKTTKGAVLCATSSFWQGVDVRGDALRAVMIDKLPFPVPNEPIVAARARSMEEKGENAFLGYSVPEAIITLKQGLGRLVRSRRDRGLLAIFDTRLRTRHYGRFFLQSLPNCPVTDNIEEVRNFFREIEQLDQ